MKYAKLILYYIQSVCSSVYLHYSHFAHSLILICYCYCFVGRVAHSV